MEVEHKNCEFDEEWKDAHCDNWAGPKELLQGLSLLFEVMYAIHISQLDPSTESTL